MNSVALSITSDSFSHPGVIPLIVKSNDGQIRVETHIRSRFGSQTPAHENTRFQSGNRASLLAAVSLASLMGATAAQCVFGKITPINKNRGRAIDLNDGIKALVTVHPSYLLRLPDADAKAREYERFVDDLKMAAALLRKSARAA